MNTAQIDSLRISLDPLGQAGIASALALLVYSIALGLRTADFAFLRARPRLFFGGLAAQLIGLPMATFLLVLVITPAPSLALGMLVVAACPGGASSNFLTSMARGDVALSVSITAASSLLGAVLTPVSILFWVNAYPPTAALLESISFSPLAFLAQTFVLLGIPLAAGMATTAYFPELARSLRRPVSAIGGSALLGVVIYGTVNLWDTLAAALPTIAPLVVLHNALALLTGAAAGRLLGAAQPQARALVFEIGIQNSGLALVILLTQIDGLGGALATTAVWGVWHLVAGGTIVMVFRAADRREALKQ